MITTGLARAHMGYSKTGKIIAVGSTNHASVNISLVQSIKNFALCGGNHIRDGWP